MTINNFESIELNVIDVLKKRRLNFLPVHFKSVAVDDFNIVKVEDWVNTKLRGRFCISRIPRIGKDEKLRTTTIVGFEEEKELTYFMLACPYTRRT